MSLLKHYCGAMKTDSLIVGFHSTKGWLGLSQLRAIFHPPNPQRAKTRLIPSEGLSITSL
jgi:hypothetical protein